MKAFLIPVLILSLSHASFAAKEVITAYVVKRGDTYASIAKRFGLTKEELKKGITAAWTDRGCLEIDPWGLQIAKVLYIKHMDYSEEEKRARIRKFATELTVDGTTRELQHQLTAKRLLEYEQVFEQKISDEDFCAALWRFDNNQSWCLREKVANAEGRKEIYDLFNTDDGKPDYALLFNGERKSLYRIDETKGNTRIVTQLYADKPRNVVDIKDFKKAFKNADAALVLTIDVLYIMCNRRYWQDIKIVDTPAFIGDLYFGAKVYGMLNAVCPNTVRHYRVNLKFITDEADPIDLGYYYLDAKISRKSLIMPMKKGLQDVVDRNWRLDRSASRSEYPPMVTDSEVRYLIDCPGHLKMMGQ
jgi:hypothetical protein